MLRKFTIYPSASLRTGNLQFTIKLILFLFTFTFYLFTLPSPAFAQTLSQPSTSKESQPLPAYIPPTSPVYTDLLVNNLFHTFSCLAVGQSVIGQPCLTYQVTKNAEGTIQSVPMLSSVNLSGGALGGVTSVIGALYQNPPVRTADYLASVGQSFGVVKEAHAQVTGSGAGVLSPILSLWQVSRNISYVIMILIFVIIGLMVMFRNKINPQIVITAQAALPGLVIGLIMITFSYFLAGLISDMAFVGTNVVGYYFAAAQGPTALTDPQRTNLAQHISGQSVVKIFGSFVGITSDHANDIYNTILNLLPPDVASTVRVFVGLMTGQLLGPIGGIIGPYSAIATPIVTLVAGVAGGTDLFGLTGLIIKFAVVGILLYAMFNLLIRLVNCYLTIIFLTISAPFQFLFASLPGRQGILTGWIRNLLGNVLVFPAVIAIFYFVAVILGSTNLPKDFPLKISESNRIQNNTFTPAVYADDKVEEINIVGRDNFPLFGGMDLSFVKILLAIGALIALPRIPDIVIRAVGKASEAGQLLGQEISGNIRAGQGYTSQYGSRIAQSGQSLGTGLFGESYRGAGGEIITTKKGLLPSNLIWGKKTPVPEKT